MPERNTKQKILDASIKLFNEQGLANVRLQQIANEIGISPGNLAYHFKNKEAIVDAVSNELYEELTSILTSYRIYPNMIDFDYQLSQYYNFLEKYPFFFVDLLEIERHFPNAYANRQQTSKKMISQLRMRIDYKMQRGMVKPEPKPGLYDHLATAMWTLILFWAPHNSLRGQDSLSTEQVFKEFIWHQLYPFLTAEGIREFNQLIIPMLQKPSPGK